ncbi:hypothetical protein [Methylobacterium sp. A54F]
MPSAGPIPPSAESDAAPAEPPSWREERNRRARARLARALPPVFPGAVLRHALARPLVPPTPRLAVESYWRAHVLRADRLARALAARSGAPPGWRWGGPAAGRIAETLAAETLAAELLATDLPAADAPAAASPAAAGEAALRFRLPPAPYREAAHARGAGHCCLCGQPVYRYGWHRDLWGTGAARTAQARWHTACVTAWKLWIAPSGQVKVLKARQRHRCADSGKRLLRTAEVDHRVPLHRVWAEHRHEPWPDLLGYWGLPNLQVVNRAAHARKSGAEATERARLRRAAGAPDKA